MINPIKVWYIANNQTESIIKDLSSGLYTQSRNPEWTLDMFRPLWNKFLDKSPAISKKSCQQQFKNQKIIQ